MHTVQAIVIILTYSDSSLGIYSKPVGIRSFKKEIGESPKHNLLKVASALSYEYPDLKYIKF